jgi:hypothetical protein
MRANTAVVKRQSQGQTRAHQRTLGEQLDVDAAHARRRLVARHDHRADHHAAAARHDEEIDKVDFHH